ncbi:MAG: XisI protein, partial [Saprospiraceae bacterium]|nr:XisI protein [Saprospiraceae bacterium]
MDKSIKYKQIVRELATEIALSGKSLEKKNIETQLITDDEHGHYLLYFNGWRDLERTYGCFLHVDVTPEGKVWLQYDGTDLIVAELLLEKGISKQDIVLGFQAPYK